jgi:hypothetical protein
VIYYWAQATKLSREDMLVLLEKQSAQGAPDPAAHGGADPAPR